MVGDLPEVSADDQLVFRVNRDVVVLNDVLAGRMWLPADVPVVRDPNWDDIGLQEEIENPQVQEQADVATADLTAECAVDAGPPTAADDEFGVRAGRTVMLPVLDNDVSSACGILAVSQFDPVDGEFGTLTSVNGGQALQLAVAPGAQGSVDFTYTVADGRAGVEGTVARVRVTVHPDDQNGAPVQVRAGSLSVEQGGWATYDVLNDFRDPDGDQLVLVSATADGGGTAYPRGDGRLRFQSDGSTLGRQVVSLTVSDGVDSVDGTVEVDIRAAGSLPPVIDPVHVTTFVGEPVVVRPLDAVRSASREPVRLVGVDPVVGLDVALDAAGGTFTASSATAGTYYVYFTVTAAPLQSVGMARVDVLERPQVDPPPVAVLDLALLPDGGEVTIDPLANDVDFSGSVLAVQSVDVPAGSGLRVAVLDHRLLRVTATRTLTGSVAFGYTVSNGVAQALGQVVVQPVRVSATQQAPVVPDVEATVRTGGVVSIDVLADAYDPDGDSLTLVHELTEPVGAGQGLMFVSGDQVRFQAPDEAMEVRATFTVTDPFGNATAATVTVVVHASDADQTALPRPSALVARVYEGETVRIPVPLTGIDDDGDGVRLVGVDTAPVKGMVTEVGPDWLEYQALPEELGTDTFTYAVQDWTGRRATATVQVGIIARPDTAALVVAQADEVRVRPGQTVAVRVLGNDVDTDGGVLVLDEVLEMDPSVDAVVDGEFVQVTTGPDEGVLQIAYTARNARGGADTAVLTVVVSQDAPFLAPVARDVVVSAAEVIGLSAIEVDVLAKAENPSGPIGDLDVSVHSSATGFATVTDDKTVVVTLGERARVVPYLLTNTDPRAEGAASWAFIMVPALGDVLPTRSPSAPELVVVAGQTLTIPVAEQVFVAAGRTPRVADLTRVTATKSDGSALVVDEDTLQYTPRADYAGPASITALIGDGPVSDPATTTAMVTLPITVLAAEQRPPTFTPSTLDVAAGETVRVDLDAFTSDPVRTTTGLVEYTYQVGGPVPDGFSASVDRSVLTVTADADAPVGTLGVIEVAIGYGTGQVTGRVQARVVASNRPLARVVDVLIEDGSQGQERTVSVLDGAYNPFPDPLTVREAVVETPGAGTATVSGSQVTVRPEAGFTGAMVTRFTVADATGDPERFVEARITLMVRGRPDSPNTPRVVEVQDSTVVLAWAAPANNGAPITGYQVTDQNAGIERQCPATTCTIDGLTNGTEYQFTVAAGNSVGWSDPSPPSAPVTPDARPGTPNPPTLERRDGAVYAQWAPPTNTGTPITGYEVEISPDPTGTVRNTTGTTILINGLTNGTAYQVRVRAHNSAPEPGEWSPWSTPQTPAGPPEAPTNLTATNTEVGAGIDVINVSWGAASANGDAITAYRIIIGGGADFDTVSGSTLSYSFPAAKGVVYQISVTAENTLGTGPSATTTGEIWSAPGVPTAVTAGDGPPCNDCNTAYGNGIIVVSWAAPTDTGGEGITISRIEVEGPGISGTADGNGNHMELAGYMGGSSNTFRVRAVNSMGAASDWVTSTAAVPTTVPRYPVLSLVALPGALGVIANVGDNGGAAVDQYRYRVDGRDWQVISGGEQYWLDVDEGSTVTVEAQLHNARGWSLSGTGSVAIPSR